MVNLNISENDLNELDNEESDESDDVRQQVKLVFSKSIDIN